MAQNDNISNLIQINKQRLAIPEDQRARFGYNTPPQTIIEIEDIEAKIEEMENEKISRNTA